MKIKYKIDQQGFIVRVVKGTSDDEWVPGYVCESDIEGRIYSTPTAVVNESYKKYSDTKTRFSGPDVLVLVTSIGSPYQEELNFVGPGYLSTFFCKYSEKKSLICQSIIDTQCQIDVYFQGKLVCTHMGSTPTDVWNRLMFLRKYDGKKLFGLTNSFTIQKIEN
ncbi:8443_t:CDS:2 [Entrophospora sp. SA101]|nr:8443_t:CDS:2 [Entrophospora sp. SA101]